MGVGKMHPLFDQSIDIRRGDIAFGIQRTDRVVTHVISEDENNVGLIGCNGAARIRSQDDADQHCPKQQGIGD